MAVQKKSPANLLNELKGLDLSKTRVHLIIVREYKQGRTSRYILKYVETDKNLNKRLRAILIAAIAKAQEVEVYAFDAPEPEGGLIRSIDYAETDFHKIYDQYDHLNPEEDKIEDVKELAKAKGYLIVLTGKDKEIIGYRRIPESWKPVADRNLFNVLFHDKTFVDLEDENVFSIANSIEMFYFRETVFILSMQGFERAMNFREGMMERAEVLYEEFSEQELFVDLNFLKEKVGNNQRYLRQLAIIENKGYYKDQAFLDRLLELSVQKHWNIQFVDGHIQITDQNFSDVLILLQNRRLHSEITDEDFDVGNAKPVGAGPVV
jgi:Domain of unknown function (DUF4868)